MASLDLDQIDGALDKAAERLRAADALADAVELWMEEGPPPAEIWAQMENALEAYREAQ